jgi:hypothetical protein
LNLQAGDKRWGTDESVFVDIFSRRSRPHLKAVFKEFKKVPISPTMNLYELEIYLFQID